MYRVRLNHILQILCSYAIFGACVCLNVCTSGPATVVVTGRDPAECEDDPVWTAAVAVLNEMVLCRQQQLN